MSNWCLRSNFNCDHSRTTVEVLSCSKKVINKTAFKDQTSSTWWEETQIPLRLSEGEDILCPITNQETKAMRISKAMQWDSIPKETMNKKIISTRRPLLQWWILWQRPKLTLKGNSSRTLDLSVWLNSTEQIYPNLLYCITTNLIPYFRRLVDTTIL